MGKKWPRWSGLTGFGVLCVMREGIECHHAPKKDLVGSAG